MIINKNIDNGKAFDWSKASELYAKYRDIYPDEFYKKIIELGLCTNGQNVLDIGTGTGVLPRNMYKYGAKFTGADISKNQIKEAINLSKKDNMKIDYLISKAEDINFPDSTFDVVTACQCFMYFDKKIIIPNIHRMLKPSGHLCILFMAWLPEDSEIAQKSEDLVLKYNPSWTGARMTRKKMTVPKEIDGLFTIVNNIGFDADVKFTRESWHGRIKSCRGIGASSLSKEEIDAWEKEHTEYLKTVPETLNIKHYISMLDLKKYKNFI